MKAMLLAAGFGRRLVPITLTRAKPTLPFLNRPLLLRQLDYLQAHHITDVVINLHHQPDSVRDLLMAAAHQPDGAGETVSERGVPRAASSGDGDEEPPRSEGPFPIDDLRVRLSHEPERLGTSGGLWGAAAALRGDGTFLCINSDMITGIDLTTAAEEHRRLGRAASLVLVPWRQGCTDTQVHHGDGLLTGFGGSGRKDDMGSPGGDSPGVFTGIHFLEEEILDRLPPGRSEFLPDLYLPMLAAGEPPGVIMTTESWVEVGTPARYLDGQVAARRAPAPAGHRPWATTGPSADRAAPDADAADDAIMDDTVSLEPGVAVTRSVLMERAQVGAGSRLEEVIAGPGTRIPGGLDIRRAVLAPADENPPADLPENVHVWKGMLRADF